MLPWCVIVWCVCNRNVRKGNNAKVATGNGFSTGKAHTSRGSYFRGLGT